MKALAQKVVRSLENIGSSSFFARMSARTLALAALMCGSLAPASAAAAAYQSTLTVSGYVGESTLENFPVLVRISTEKISGFSYGDCAADGADLSFVDAEGNMIPHEIDTWNTAGESTVWVKLPTLATNTTFTMRWGDPVSDTVAASATWNDDYVGVWHMDEASGTCANATAKGSKYDAEPVGATATSTLYSGTDAPIGGARTTATRTGGSCYLQVPSYKDENVTDTFTISGWLRADGANGSWPRPFARRYSWENADGGFMVGFNSMKVFTTIGVVDSNKKFDTRIPDEGCADTWTHLAIVYEGAMAYAYVNGTLGNSGTIVPVANNDSPLYFGSNPGNSGTYFMGAFDECRLLKAAASADWVQAEYATVASSDFLTASAATEYVPDHETLGIGNVVVVSVTDNAATFSVNVLGLGAGETSVTAKFVYGSDAENLTQTQTVAQAISSLGSATLTLTHLYPDRDYCVSVVLTNSKDASVTSRKLLAITTKASSDASSSGEISIAENISDGALASITLTFEAAASDRTLLVASGPSHGGETTDGWKSVEKVTVAANETSYVYSMPESWGTDDNLVVRFAFDATPLQWSASTYWHEASEPAVMDVAIDATGGDQLKVSGALTAFAGATCTLQALVGESADALVAWSEEGWTRDATGAFTLALNGSAAPEGVSLRPGAKYYVRVVATSGGKTSLTKVFEATMAGAAAFNGDPKCTVSRRTVTVKGALSDLGFGTITDFSLYVGTSNSDDALAKAEATVTRDGLNYSAVYELPAFEKTYWCQIRATNTSPGDTTNVVTKSARVSFTTKDTTTYTWQGGTSDTWETKDNWANSASGDCLGYPQSANAKAVFPANTTAKIALRKAWTIGGLDLSAEGASLTLAQGGASRDATKLTVSNGNGGLALTGANASLTLDGIALTTSSGNVNPGATFAFTIKNGSNFYCSSDIKNEKGGTITVSGGSTASVNNYWSGPGTLVIDDSTNVVRNAMVFYSTGKSTVNFLGAKPLLSFTSNGGFITPNNDKKGCDAHFVFSVPEGGYATPPVQGHAKANYVMGNWQNNTYTGTLTADVAADSPAAKGVKSVTTALISWSKGISTNFVQKGSLPKRSSFDWGETLVNDRPTALDVTFGGSQGFMLFVR